MAKTTAGAALILAPEEQQQLQSLAAARTAPLREVQRAKTLLGCHAGQSFSTLSRTVRLSRCLIYKHVDRVLAAGVAVALRDRPPGAATDDHARRQCVGALGGLHQAQGPRVGGRTLGPARLWPSTFGAQPRPPDTPRWLGPPNRPSLPSCAPRPFAHTKSNATENDGIRSLSGR